jgi:HTH-type transcriptional regulator prtR (pyocin repressor protein)|nr:MAG TPA: Repressor protein CI [Bacteriophage sp.]
MNTLAERLQFAMDKMGKNQVELAALAGTSQVTISNILNGVTKSPRNGLQIAKALKISPEWLLNGTGEISQTQIESNVAETGSFDLWDRNTPLNDDEVEVPLFQEIRLAAGNGFADDIMDYNNFKLRFSRATLRRQGVQYENAVCVVADGNSMEPVIPNGATVGIDTGNKTIRDGSIYAINHGGLLRIKLLYNMPNNQIKIRSYNTDEYDDEIADLNEVSVIGKVFWYSVLL